MGLFNNKRSASSIPTAPTQPLPLITLTDTQSPHPEQFTTLSPLQVRRPSASLRDLQARAYERWVNDEHPPSFFLRRGKKAKFEGNTNTAKASKVEGLGVKAMLPKPSEKAEIGGKTGQIEDISSLSAPSSTTPTGKATLQLPPGALPKEGYVGSLRRSDRKKTKTTGSFTEERARRYSVSDEIGLGMSGILLRT